jgi:signal peptidase
LKPREGETLTLPNAAIVELMEAVLEKGGVFRLHARGTSMIPFLRDGDVLTVAPFGNRPPLLGEVVAFSDPASKRSPLVVHRIVGRHKTGFVVQGDGNGCAPEIVSPENIVGMLVKAERDGRPLQLGLGPERGLIAWLSRTRLLWSVVWPLWSRVRRPFMRLRSLKRLCRDDAHS